jgi:phosphate-selective porin OprO/OprP
VRFSLADALEPEPLWHVPAATNLTPQVKDAYFPMNQIPYLGRFAIQSEAFLGTVQMLSGQSPQLSGAYVHTSWFVTGESRSFERFGQHGAQFGRLTPFENFMFKQGEFGPGALELKSRWSHLDMNQLNAGQYNDLTVGFNWYRSDRTRWMFDWIHPITSSQTVYGPTVSDLLAMRFDFNW